MITTTTELLNKEQEPKFPTLMRLKGEGPKLIVLATRAVDSKTFAGTVIHAGKNYENSLGNESDNWVLSRFEEYFGSVTISNFKEAP